ncbi:MAG: hypothetical protein U0X73_09375 [Thermoanaerobaculia bacterium]
MAPRSIEEIFRALLDARVRFVVVGGVAVVLQGYPRLTLDLDLVLALDRENVLRTVGALERLGFQPRVAVRGDDFADPETRRAWARDRAMMVFSWWSDAFPGADVDLFVEEPIPFERLESTADEVDLESCRIRVASIDHLLEMKRRAGRPRDLEDVQALVAIQAARQGR